MNYGKFRKLEESNRLSEFFNSIMGKLEPMRMMCTPDSFDLKENLREFQDSRFSKFIRYEIWMHSVVERLEEWRHSIYEYGREYHWKWKYYASYKRISCIKEIGGDEGDYNPDGTIKADVEDEMLESFSLRKDLYDEEFRDIVNDTVPSDLDGFCCDLMATSQIDIAEGIRQVFGKTVPLYKYEDGERREVSRLEHSMDMVGRQVDAEDDSTTLKAVAGTISMIILMIRKYRYDTDGKWLLTMIDDCCEALQDMRFDLIHDIIQKFREYEDDIHER